MAQVKVEFVLKGSDKLVTTNETIIKQLVEQGAKYKVLEGSIDDLIGKQTEQTQSTEEVSKSYKEVLKDYKDAEKELKALAIAGDTTSERYQELAKSVGASRAALDDANRAGNAQKGTFDAILGASRGVTGGYAAITGAMNLIGKESEDLQKALLKVQSALALTQGLKDFQEAIPTFKTLGKVISGNVTKAFNLLKVSIGATGIGLIVIAVGLLVANWDKLVESLRSAFPAFKVIENFFKDFKNIAFGALNAVVAGFKQVGVILQNLFRGNLAGVAAEAKRFGEVVGQAYTEGYNKSVEKGDTERLIKQLERERDAAIARGEVVLEIERQIIEAKLRLVKEGSDEQIKLDNELVAKKREIAKKIEDDTKAAEERLLAIRRANADRRIALLNDGLRKELAQLRQNYEEQRRLAIKNGEDVSLVDQLFNKNRVDLIERFKIEYIKKVNEIYTELNRITTGSYLVEEAALRRNQEEQRRLLDQQILDLQNNIKLKENELQNAASKETSQKDKTLIEDIKRLEKELSERKQAQQELLTFLTEAEEDYNNQRARLSKARTEDEREEIQLDIDAAEFRLQREKQRNNSQLETIKNITNTLNLRKEELKQLTEREKLEKTFTETFRKSEIENLQLLTKEFGLAKKAQEDLFAAQLEAVRQEKIIAGLKAEVDAREKAGEDVLELQLKLFDKEFELFSQNEQRKVRQRAEIEKLLAGGSVDDAKAAGEAAVAEYIKVIAVVEKAAKKRIEFSNEVTKIEKQQTKESLDTQLKYYDDLSKISTTNTRKRKKQEANIQAQFDREELKRQIEVLDKKLAAAKKAFGEESDEFKKLQLEKAKLENKFIDQSIKDNKKRIDTFTQLFQQFLSTLAEIGAAIDSFYELEAARTNAFYDEEVRKNTEANNAEVNNYALSAEERQNINQRFALQEAEIEEKRAADIKKIEKKRADIAFRLQVAQIIGNGALATIRAFAELGPIAGAIAATLISATTAAQLVTANNQRKVVQQLEDGGLLVGASHSQGGIPVGNTGIEVEGGEAVINKRSTAKFLPILSAINQAGGGAPLMPRTSTFMQNGGMMMLPQTGATQSTVMKTYVVSEEVTNKQTMESRIRRLSQF